MPIRAAWLHEPTIRHHNYQGKITAKELEDFVTSELAMLNTTDNKLYYVVDFIHVESFPLNLTQIPSVLELMRHSNLGAIAFTGTPSVLNFWAAVFNKITNFKLIKADSVAHAQDQLEKMYGIGSGTVQPGT